MLCIADSTLLFFSVLLLIISRPVFSSKMAFCHLICLSYHEQEIRSVERSICPIAALNITKYSLNIGAAEYR